MPSYTVELEDGRKFRVQADNPPTNDEIQAYLSGAPVGPDDSGQGRASSFLSSVGRGAASIVPGVVGGVGYLTGSETLTGAADTMEQGINSLFPVNPIYEDEFLMKAGNVLGQAGNMVLTGGATGLAGKALAASRGLKGVEAAAKGTQLANRALMGSAVLQGVRGGGQEAEKYGMTDGRAYARALLGGAIEGISERVLGLGAELAPVRRLVGDTIESGINPMLRAVGTESAEEAMAEAGGNVSTTALVPEGVQTPSILENVPEAAALGALAGGAIGGVTSLMDSSAPEPAPVIDPVQEKAINLQQAVQETVSTEAQGDERFAPIQRAAEQNAAVSVAENKDLLPATAAALEAAGITLPEGEAAPSVEGQTAARPLTDQVEGAGGDNVIQEEGSISPVTEPISPQIPEASTANETTVETDPIAGFQPDGVTTLPTNEQTQTVEGPATQEVLAGEVGGPAAPGAAVDPATADITSSSATEEVAGSPTGIANARVDEARRSYGLDDIYEPVRQTMPALWDEAAAAATADPAYGSALVSQLNAKPHVTSPLEVGVLTHEAVVRKDAADRAMLDYNADPSELNKQRLTDAVQRYNEAASAFDVAGTQAGRALAARKLLVNSDFTLVRMLAERQSVNGPLTPAQVEETQALHKKIADLQRKLDERQTAEDNIDLEELYARAKEEAKAELQEQAKADKLAEEQVAEAKKKAKAEKKSSFWEDLEAGAMARRKARRGRLNAGGVVLLAVDTADLMLIGAARLARGIQKFADWAASMSADFQDLSQSELERLYQESENLYNRETGAPAPKPNLDEQIAANAADGEAVTPRHVYEKVKEKVKAGIEKFEDIIKAVTLDLQKHHPDLTERQVRDTLSGYGKTSFPSQDELEKRVREIRALSRLTSAIEDAERKRAPLKTGPQRDAATQEVRALQKRLHKAMQENGIETVSAENQLRGARDAIKKRLQNQIEDLEKEIATGEKTARKPPVEDDAETQALRARRDELKKIADELGDTDPTPQDRIKAAMRNLDKQITDLERRIKEQDFAPKGVPTPETEQLQVKRDQRDALREQLQQLKVEVQGEPMLSQEEVNRRAEASLKRAIDDLEQRIKDQDFSTVEGQKPENTLALNRLRARRDALREQYNTLREAVQGKKQPSDAERIERAIASLEKSNDRLNEKINQGDIRATPRAEQPQNAKLRNIKAENESLRGEFQRLRKQAQDMQKDPVGEQIARDKTALRRRITELETKLKNKDFSKKKKRPQYQDEEKRQLQFKLEEAKENWAKLLFEEQLAKRGAGAKAWDFTKQTLNTARAILTSVDVSAVLRQGGFITLGNPVMSFKNLKPMFKAFASKEFESAEKERLKERENYPLYQQAKLFLADTGNVNQLTKQEEAFMSRWLDKIPKWAGGGILRGSQRAYTVFLNQLRADAFDTMLGTLQKGPQPTVEEMASIANYINVATGRGDLGKFSQAAEGLNTVFFAPRLVASRFQLLAGQPFFKATGRTKQLVLREYAKFLTGAAMVYALGMLAQDDDDKPIETDPRSSDFGKIRFGNTRVDPLSGLIQATVFLSRLATGEKKTAKGKVVPLRDEYRLMNLFRDTPKTDKVPYGADDTFDVLTNFARSKFSPAFGAAVNLITGKNVVGEKTDVSDEAERMVIPMSFSEAKETLQEHGLAEGLPLTVLSLFGMGVQTYDQRKK